MHLVTRRFSFWYGIAAIAAGALALRLWIVFGARPTRTHGIPGGASYVLAGDAAYYQWQGRAIGDGLGYIDPLRWQLYHEIVPSAAHVPLFSGFLGALSWIGIEGVTAHRVAGSLLGVLTVVLIGMCARKLGGDRTGLIAAALAALYPQLWINDGMVLSETIAVPAVALSLLLAYQLRERPTFPRAAALGFAIALAALSRSELTLLFVLLGVPLVFGLKALTWSRRIKLLAVLGATGFIVMSPWLVYTTTTFDRPVALSTSTGAVLSAGSCDAVFYGSYIGYYGNCFQGPFPPLSLDESQRDRYPYKYATNYLGNHQKRIPIVVAARVGRLWGVFKPGQTTTLDWWLEGRGRFASWAGLYSFYALMIPAIGGIVVLRRRHIPISPLIALVVIVTLAAMTTFGVTRYRAPAEPAIVIAAAVGIDAFLRRWRAAKRGPSSVDEPSPPPSAPDAGLVDASL